MCGIAGIIHKEANVCQEILLTFVECLRHRGPDDDGIYISKSGNAGLAHTRLSILDLSPLGHQPMALPGGRYTIVFNGEIYNFRELKQELEQRGNVFSSDCDTEVLLRLYVECGPQMLDRLEGMFAFAIWDEEQQSCFLARDPLGIKPLYIWQQAGSLAFASELRVLLSLSSVEKNCNLPALEQYFLFGSVPEPSTVVSNVQMLPAGHWGLWHDGEFQTNLFWEPRYPRTFISESEAIATTRTALEESVRRHFVSDVPVGIFLSGGMDSTALVALARAQGIRHIKTFCISFDEEEYDEGSVARRTAEHFQTEHHDWRLTSLEGESLVREFLSSVDRPSNDGFNTYCVSKFARSHGLKVVLSGLGGDELFGSYPSFDSIPKLLRFKLASGWLLGLNPVIAAVMQKSTSDFRVTRLAELVRAPAPATLVAYWTMRGFFTPHEAKELVHQLTGDSSTVKEEDLLNADIPAQSTAKDLVAYLETTRYLRHQLLRDSDVFSMVHGLELRVPYVDRKLFDVIAKIPAAIRLAHGKKLLADAVPELPEWVVNAPKRGFRFPFDDWVMNQWGGTFAETIRQSPIPLRSWYRKWSYFAMDSFLKTHGLAK